MVTTPSPEANPSIDGFASRTNPPKAERRSNLPAGQAGDADEAFSADCRVFWDVVVSNPPYVAKEDWPTLSREVLAEPRLALDGGVRGLETIECLLKQAPFFIKKGGWLIVEIGAGQSVILSKRFRQNGAFKNFKFMKDLNGIDRILIAQHG